MTLHNVKIYQL